MMMRIILIIIIITPASTPNKYTHYSNVPRSKPSIKHASKLAINQRGREARSDAGRKGGKQAGMQ